MNDHSKALNRFNNLCNAIDQTVLGRAKPSARLGDDLKVIATYKFALDRAVADVATHQNLLKGCSLPEPQLAAKIEAAKKRVLRNKEGIESTAAHILQMRTDARRQKQVGRNVDRMMEEIENLEASNKEREAIDLEYQADLIEIAEPDRCRREARKIRSELVLAKTKPALDALLTRLDGMIALAEKAVTALAETIERHRVDRARRAANTVAVDTAAHVVTEDSMAGFVNEDGSPIEFENVALDPLPKPDPKTATEQMLLHAFVEQQGLNPNDPWDIELAKGTMTDTDRACALAHLRSQST